MASYSKPTDYSYPKWTQQDKDEALRASFRYLQITEYVRPSMLKLFASLDIVNVQAGQVRCCGILKSERNYGARCSKQIDKEELARTLLSLQTLAVDRSVNGNELCIALRNTSIHLLCKKPCQSDEGAVKLGDRSYEVIKQYRRDFPIEQRAGDGFPMVRSEREYAKGIRERDEARKQVAQLTERIASLKFNNTLLETGLLPTTKVNFGEMNRSSRPSKSRASNLSDALAELHDTIVKEEGIESPKAGSAKDEKDSKDGHGVFGFKVRKQSFNEGRYTGEDPSAGDVKDEDSESGGTDYGDFDGEAYVKAERV